MLKESPQKTDNTNVNMDSSAVTTKDDVSSTTEVEVPSLVDRIVSALEWQQGDYIHDTRRIRLILCLLTQFRGPECNTSNVNHTAEEVIHPNDRMGLKNHNL